MKSKKKKLIERLIILGVALIVAALLVFFLKDIIVPFIKYEIQKDNSSAQKLLMEKGWKGWVTVSLVEALQMVVIFVPAEFIQLTSGMSYPWWMAIILCDIGVILGSSIIYFLVNLFKFDGDVLNKGGVIKQYEKRTRVNNTIVFMFILFIMPIIPFGAICYYASNKKIPYWKYVLTCAIAVIPSICTSIIMGTAVRLFIVESMPLWALILAIIGAAAILFLLLAFVLHKFFFKQNNNTPDSVFYSLSIGLGFKLLKLRNKVKVIGREKLENIEGPYLLIGSHHSFLDPYAVTQIMPYDRTAFVFNKYYLRIPIWGKMLTRAGLIPKKMFTPDFECATKTLRTLKNGYSVTIFPEGRLSTDGGPSDFDESIAKLAIISKVPVILTQIRGGYFNKPKWRKNRYSGKLEVEVMDVLTPEKIKDLSVDEVHRRIKNAISFNDFENEHISYKKKNLAKGLENVLYMCPHCKTMYENTTKGRTITCPHCGKSYTLDSHYQFIDSDIKNPHDYYGLIKKIELENLDNVSLDIEVETTIFSKDMKEKRQDKGVFHFDSKHISYKSSVKDFSFEYETSKLEGLAYSVDEEFEMYHAGELYYFYPTQNKKICTRVALLQELVRERDYGTNKE